MKNCCIVLASLLLLTACTKVFPYWGENGFVSVDGEKKLSLDYLYRADMRGIGLGDLIWYGFEKSQKIGEIDYDDTKLNLRANTDKQGVLYPFTVFIHDVPGCEDLFLDGIDLGEKGYYSKRLAHYVKEGEEPEYNYYYVQVDAFSFESPRLKVDLTITSDAFDHAIRIKYSGKTPFDGMQYWMD